VRQTLISLPLAPLFRSSYRYMCWTNASYISRPVTSAAKPLMTSRS